MSITEWIARACSSAASRAASSPLIMSPKAGRLLIISRQVSSEPAGTYGVMICNTCGMLSISTARALSSSASRMSSCSANNAVIIAGPTETPFASCDLNRSSTASHRRLMASGVIGGSSTSCCHWTNVSARVRNICASSGGA